MGKIDRLKRITLARIEAFLDSLEKPELILPQLLNEMEQQMREAAAAKAKALSAVKGARRRLDEAAGRSLRLERGAALAVRAGDLKTARQALAAQLEAEQQYQRHQTELENVEKAYLAAEAVFKQISENRDALKKKNTQLLRQHRQQQVVQILCDQYTRSVIEPKQSILDAVIRIETKIEQQQVDIEAKNDLARILGTGAIEEHIKSLEHIAQVEERLAALKKQLRAENDPDSQHNPGN